MRKTIRPIFAIGLLAFSIICTEVSTVQVASRGTDSAVSGIDANTLLLLKFDNSLDGVDGEQPASAVGHLFESGVQGQGVSIPTGSQLFYPAANNIDAREGTIEFWIKPSWNGNDGQIHAILDWGGRLFGGIRIEKNGYSRLAIALDTFQQWVTLDTDVSSWIAGEWHHVAITFSNTSKKVQIYIDGSKRIERTFTSELPLTPYENFQIGGAEGTEHPLNAVLDEFRISNRVRTEQEILQSFLTPLTVNSLSFSAVTTTLWPTWRIPVTITGGTNIGDISIPVSGITWSSTLPDVAGINLNGEIAAQTPGDATIMGTLNGVQVNIAVTVKAPALPPKIEVPTGFRSQPAAGHLYEIPVVSLRYLPTADGINIDTAWGPDFWSLNAITLAQAEQNLDRYDEICKFMLEEGSRFRGYGSHTAPPSLGYRVVATITVYEPTPPGRVNLIYNGYPLYMSEFFQIYERLNIRDYVEGQGVKDIWLWTPHLDSGMPSYDPAIHPPENFRGNPESNMASPVTGDISNSFGDPNDLPIYNRTYIVINRVIVYGPDTGTLHQDGHQWERMLEYVNWLQDGNHHLFWRNFVGNDTNNQFQRGRAGATHHPPNGVVDYDYHNYNPFTSNIIDWNPDGSGQTIEYSAATARDTAYIFPNNFLLEPRPEPHWYIYWRQSMPGRNNSIPYEPSSTALGDNSSRDNFPNSHDVCIQAGKGFRTISVPRSDMTSGQARARMIGQQDPSGEIISSPAVSNRMTNWWHFMGDWDRAISSGVGLYEPASCSYSLSSTSQSYTAGGGTGSVTVTAPAGCKWFASNNAMWTPLVSGDLGDGTGTVNFNVLPNTLEGSRTTQIVVAGQPFIIEQAAGLGVPTPTPTPTATPITNVMVSGQVLTPDGRGLANATVAFTDPSGVTRVITTSTFGSYSFSDIPLGENYVIRVSSKRFRFTVRNLFVDRNMSNINFTGIE